MSKEKNEIFTNPLKEYPRQKLFFLQYMDFVIIAKITEKNFYFDEKEKHYSFSDNPFNLFSLYNKGIKLDTENWRKVCPEKVAKYIAGKTKNFSLIIDAFSGIGGNTLQVLFSHFFNELPIFEIIIHFY